MTGIQTIFHLAADRGRAGLRRSPSSRVLDESHTDGMIFRAAHEMGVEKVVFVSSGCVYPNNNQMNPDEELFLTEDMVGPPFDVANM